MRKLPMAYHRKRAPHAFRARAMVEGVGCEGYLWHTTGTAPGTHSCFAETIKTPLSTRARPLGKGLPALHNKEPHASITRIAFSGPAARGWAPPPRLASLVPAQVKMVHDRSIAPITTLIGVGSTYVFY